MEITLTDVPMALPARCAYCGVSGRDRGPYLDTGLQFEYYGALLLCKECFTHLASKYNFIPPVVAEKLQQENEIYITTIAELEFKVTALEQAINSMKAAGFTDGDSSMDSDGVVLIELTSSSPVSYENPELVFPERDEMGEGSDGTLKPSDDEGMAKLPTGKPKPKSKSVSE